jgi:hypothetical protein
VASVLRALVYIHNLHCSDLECLDLEVLYRCHQFSRTVSVSFILYSIITAVSNLDKFGMGVLPNPEPFPEKSSKLVMPLSQLFKKLIIFETLDLNLRLMKILSSRHAKEYIYLFLVLHINFRSSAKS